MGVLFEVQSSQRPCVLYVFLLRHAVPTRVAGYAIIVSKSRTMSSEVVGWAGGRNPGARDLVGWNIPAFGRNPHSSPHGVEGTAVLEPICTG